MKQYNWGIIGTGSIASTFADALRELPKGKAYAAFSRNKDKLKGFVQKFDVDVMYTSLDTILADDSIDIIYVATPHPNHYETARAAILAGKNVLCEKPMTLSLEQSDDLIRLAKERDVFLMEALCTGFLPGYKKAREWIDSGMIGRIKRITAGFHLPESTALSVPRLLDINLGGGALLDLGIYPIYYVNSLLNGDSEIVFTSAEKDPSGADRENRTLLRCGDAEIYITSGFSYEDNHAEITGESGLITIPFASSPGSAYLFDYGNLRESFSEPVSNHLRPEAAHVMECLDNRLKESPEYPLEMTRRELRLCDRLREKWGVRYPDEKVKCAPGSPAPVSTVPIESNIDWYRDAVFYHIYPLGMCGAPLENDFTSAPVNRIGVVGDIKQHLTRIGANAVYIGPLFESSRHGYDTADYRTVDRRLGTNEDFARVCGTLHENNIKVILDGVLNHVGRDFWAFRDVRKNRANSPYCGWFDLDFGRDSNYNDGFFYEGWEGCYELVKLNLTNPDVKQYLFDCVREWRDNFGIDGLRLDVAYCLDERFLRELRVFCKSLSPDFFLLGEIVHGDYNRIMNDNMLDSVTNYQCYKGMYSAINSRNMHEIAYSFRQQSGGEHWCLYRGKSLYTFLENHDVSRLATILSDPKDLPLAYALMFAAPGIPSVYYGGEFGIKGDKKNGDNDLRPALSRADYERSFSLADYISGLAAVRHAEPALRRGDYTQLHVGGETLAFSRGFEGRRVIFAVNAGDQPATLNEVTGSSAVDLPTGRALTFADGALRLPAKTACIFKESK